MPSVKGMGTNLQSGMAAGINWRVYREASSSHWTCQDPYGYNAFTHTANTPTQHPTCVRHEVVTAVPPRPVLGVTLLQPWVEVCG